MRTAFLAFHGQHIRARRHGGSDDLDNLALACPDCNAHKGRKLTGIDPVSDEYVRLFNPRNDNWIEHFVSDGPFVVGKTPIGWATVALLDMNRTGTGRDAGRAVAERVSLMSPLSPPPGMGSHPERTG